MDIQTLCIIVAIILVFNCILWFIFKPKNADPANLEQAIQEKDKFQFEKRQLQVEKNHLEEEKKQLEADLSLSEKKNSQSLDEISSLKLQIQSQEKVLNEAVKQKEQQLMAHYDELFKTIQNEKETLTSALEAAQNGKIDESVKVRLAGVEDLKLQLENLKKEREALAQEVTPLKDSVQKLTNKVKDLEEEIEEAEDEQNQLEKKLRSKVQELAELNDALGKSQSSIKKLEENLRQKEWQLEESLAALELKTGSIEFVQEILTAKASVQQDSRSVHKAIDSFEAFIRGQFMDCNAYLYNTYPNLNFNGIEGRAGFVEKKKMILQLFEEWASVKRKSWLDGKTTIAFVGEFSAGKTSIVNRILSQDNPNVPLLPVSTKATTAIPTYIAGGESERYNFVTPDEKLKMIDERVFKKVSKEVLDEIKGVSALIKYFVMTYKNPNLNGLSILDTPGFNSNDDEDKRRTVEVINECDMLFWVVDVNNGTVNRSSIARIKDDLHKPIVVVINKVDTKSTSEVDKVEALIRDTFRSEGVKVENIIRFSAKAPLQDIMKPIHAVKRETTRQTFIQDVEEDLEQLSSLFEKSVNDAKRDHKVKDDHSGVITDRFNEAMQQLWDACNEAYGIPQWTEHTFRKDRWEMAEYEGSHLLELLQNIAGPLSADLANIYNEEMAAVAEAQQAYSDYYDLKISWQKIDDCITEFKKITKPLRS